MISLMYMSIALIPVVTILLSVFYIMNDRIAEQSERRSDRHLVRHIGMCNATRCTKAALHYI